MNEQYFFVRKLGLGSSCLQTDRQTDRHTHTDKRRVKHTLLGRGNQDYIENGLMMRLAVMTKST